MQYDEATIERLVEEVTKQVLVALNTDRAGLPVAAPGHNPNCPDCERQGVQHRPHLVRQAMDAGASRFSATPGITHVDGDIARSVSYTHLTLPTNREV